MNIGPDEFRRLDSGKPVFDERRNADRSSLHPLRFQRLTDQTVGIIVWSQVIGEYRSVEMTQSLDKPAIYKVGFVSPPAWFDISPVEFLRIAPRNTIVLQTVVRPPDFDYSLEALLGAEPELRICFDSLAAAGADVVVQFGFPFSLVHGWEDAQRIQDRIRDNRDIDFVMMGVEMVHALRHLSCSTVAIASTYYSTHMARTLQQFLEAAGLGILQSESWESLGMAENRDQDLFVGDAELDPMAVETPVLAVEKAVRNVATAAPQADCILVTGGGMRMLDIAEGLEKEIRKPLVAGDLILYWGILRRLGITEGVRGHGKLLASLG